MSKFKVGQVWVTRGKQMARILATDLRDEQPIVCALMENDGTEMVIECSEDGCYYTSQEIDSFDLIREHREPREVWVLFDEDNKAVAVSDTCFGGMGGWHKFREVIE